MITRWTGALSAQKGGKETASVLHSTKTAKPTKTIFEYVRLIHICSRNILSQLLHKNRLLYFLGHSEKFLSSLKAGNTITEASFSRVYIFSYSLLETMFELGQRYKIFFRRGIEHFEVPDGYNGSDPSKYFAIGTFVGMDNFVDPIAKFRDVKLLNTVTQRYVRRNELRIQESYFSESSPDGRIHAVKVNPESGLPMGGGRRRRRTRRQLRKASRSKRGSRKN